MHVHAFNVLKTGFFTHHLGQNEKCLHRERKVSVPCDLLCDMLVKRVVIWRDGRAVYCTGLENSGEM